MIALLLDAARSARRQTAAVMWSYLLVLAAGLPFAIAAAAVMHSAFGRTLEAGEAARHLSPVLFSAFYRTHGEVLRGLLAPALGSLLLFGVASIYLSGAVYAAVSRPEPARTGDLYAGGGRVFGRMLRLSALTLPFLGVAVGLPLALGGWLLQRATEDWISEVGLLAMRLAALLLGGLWLALALAACDLMKVEAVARGEHRARYAFWRGLTRAMREPLRLLLLFVPFPLVALALTLLASLADVRLPRSGWALIALGFALQQLLALVRAHLRVALAAAEVGFGGVRRGP